MKFRAEIKTSSVDQIMKFHDSVETNNFLFHPNKLAHGPIKSEEISTMSLLGFKIVPPARSDPFRCC